MDKKIATALLLPIIRFCPSGTNRQEQGQTLVTIKLALAETTQRREFPFIVKPLRTSQLLTVVSGYNYRNFVS